MCLSLNRNVFIRTIGIYVIFKLYYVTGICSSCKIQVSNKVKDRKKDLRYKVFQTKYRRIENKRSKKISLYENFNLLF